MNVKGERVDALGRLTRARGARGGVATKAAHIDRTRSTAACSGGTGAWGQGSGAWENESTGYGGAWSADSDGDAIQRPQRQAGPRWAQDPSSSSQRTRVEADAAEPQKAAGPAEDSRWQEWSQPR